MAHWHSHNPWAKEIVYITDLEELSELLDLEKPKRHLRNWSQYGNKVDAYILPNVSGNHSCGIRYGAEPWEYLSPHINPRIASLLLHKYESRNLHMGMDVEIPIQDVSSGDTAEEILPAVTDEEDDYVPF